MAFNTGGSIVKDDLLVYIDAANPKCYPGSGTTAYDRVGGMSWDMQGIEMSGSGLDKRFANPNSSNNNSTDRLSVPTEVQGDTSFTVVCTGRRKDDYLSAGFWGFGNASTLQGIGNWNYTGDNNRITIDLWGRNTYWATDEYYPINEWIICHWIKDGAGMTTTNITIWVENRKYNDTDLTALRNVGGTPAIGTAGIAMNRISVTSNNYAAPVDVGLFGLYGRALTDAEILQNYESLRARYNQ